ncbi:YjjG family noncanonical pyrimidine nucleotidase [Aquimarina sp. D1M17]|uniref:YjjG family noncanonical pyrimidine nucleotidase n=1 Tax=Aquimarina acroporae TaxID=2937283 RepID=UPI0020BE5C65|nr:YjjG family noncanonical pyrimidine nucleotidase [Aquimarina acroporae]MCK8521648.1 YjjG family noncanonical pyrimidine nucleotidase [Aquimarina acroporae]
MNKEIKHIFFDLDHTLWDFDKNSFFAFQMVFEKFKVAIGVNQFLESYKPVNMKYWKLYREERVTKLELRRGRLIEAFGLFEIEYPIQVIDEMSEDYISFLPLNNYLIDGAKDLLDYLEPKYNMHIITNGFREVQENKLENSGIKNYFLTVTNSEEAGVKKPNPHIFKQALKSSGANVDNSVMIGDNYEADILGAQNLGFKTICFNYHREKLPVEDIQVSQLREIKMYL